EGRLRQLRQSPRDLGLADAGRPDHEDVLRRDLVAQVGRNVLPAPSIAQRDRNRPLRVVLSHDIAVEFRNDLARRHYTRIFHDFSTASVMRAWCGFVIRTGLRRAPPGGPITPR